MPPEKRRQFQVATAFALVYVLWGATYLAMRVAVEHIPAYVMGAVRFSIAGPLMLAYCALRGKKVSITRQDAPRLFAVGVLLLCIANMGAKKKKKNKKKKKKKKKKNKKKKKKK